LGIADYTLPVSQLLTLGQPEPYNSDWKQWRNYLELGLGPEQIPDLIRMATDQDLQLLNNDTKEIWASLHAWRTLGQLRTVEAIEPLIALLPQSPDDDWVLEEIPSVLGMIGPVVIPILTQYLADTKQDMDSRIAISHALEQVAEQNPEVRTECINILTQQLAKFDFEDSELNGFIISDLLELKAHEALPIVKQAFEANAVELMIIGDWEDVEVRMGLRSAEELEKKRKLERELISSQETRLGNSSGITPRASSGLSQAQKAKAKSKRKMEKASRKKNRKHK
jgi:hypothetical protein